jgi:hypothetical protein
MNNSNDILSATEPVAKAFEKLGILYFISGSLASSAISYLEQWASKLNIKQLLIKSFNDSGLYE